MPAVGRLASQSLRAVRLAAAHPDQAPGAVARRLYAYGRWPATPAIERDWGPGDDPMISLDLHRGASTRALLENAYETATYPGWLGFTRPGRSGEHPRAKLYVSPAPHALPRAFPVIAATLAAGGAHSFKVGRGLAGVLRPDKIVAYFDDFGGAAAMAAALIAALSGVPAQGVPFSGELGGDGLVSWGSDPEPEPGRPVESWRGRVCVVVADAIGEARAVGVDPVERVLARLAGLGIRDFAPVPC